MRCHDLELRRAKCARTEVEAQRDRLADAVHAAEVAYIHGQAMYLARPQTLQQNRRK